MNFSDIQVGLNENELLGRLLAIDTPTLRRVHTAITAELDLRDDNALDDLLGPAVGVADPDEHKGD